MKNDSQPSSKNRDGTALFVLTALFAVMLAASWLRWTQPIIDHGREMNLPARILAGEQLYADVQFLYGPFAPYFNAFLYRIFGVRLATLHASGVVCAALILLMIYWLARQLMGTWEAMLTAGLALVICALKSTANYVSPYAYAALYGLVFALGSLVCIMRYSWGDGARWVLLSGACAGLALISKPETAAAALAAAGAAMVLKSLSARRLRWREALSFALPVVVITAATYGFILSRVPWRTLIEDNHVLFTNMPPQLVYFNRHISGLAEWPKSFYYTATGLGMFALWAGLSALIGALVSCRGHAGWRPVAKRALGVMLLGFAWWKIVVELFRLHTDATPLTSMPIVLPLVIGALGWQAWRAWRKCEAIPPEKSILLAIAVFALVSLLRGILNVKATGPYAPFFLPAAIIVCLYLLFRFLPTLTAPEGLLRENVRRAAMALIAILIIGIAINSTYRFRSRNTFEVNAPRGRFITELPIGEPLAAIRFARERTSPGDYVLTLPQATSINFLAERRYPFKEEIIHPGFLPDEEAIRRLESRRVPLILVANLLTPEFRDRTFGVDYNPRLMAWINAHYHLVARFDSSASAGANIGDKPFFILAYERN